MQMSSLTCKSYEETSGNQSGEVDLELDPSLDQKSTGTEFLCPAKCPALLGLSVPVPGLYLQNGNSSEQAACS